MAEHVFAIGNPGAGEQILSSTYTDGKVSATGRDMAPGTAGLYKDCIQMTVPINPGNSGGPLFDDDGHVVGVNTFTVRWKDPSEKELPLEGLNFAVPIYFVHDLLSDKSSSLNSQEIAAVLSAEWTVFTSKEGRFSATFPGRPHEQTKESATGKSTYYTVNCEGGRIMYQVIFADFKTEPGPVLNPDAGLQALVGSCAKDTKEKKDIEICGHPGIELVLEQELGGEKWTRIVRFVFVNSRLYGLVAGNSVSAKARARSQEFFDSFRLQ